MSASSDTILDIRNLTISLPRGADRKYAVENVNLSIKRGEILCIVGESGSGKSVMTSAIMNDVPGRLEITSGEVVFDGQNVLQMSNAELNGLRGARISMIYQEPMAALNPAIKIGAQVDEVFALHRADISAADRKSETLRLLEQMKLPTPPRIYDSYPHQVSGGQCQRIVIAMALACKPDVLIADEPTTALDVTTQAEILRLINDLKDVYDNATIFITHDFGVVADVADRVAVMCWGKVIEEGPKEQILMHPKDPYTQLLVDAMPLLETTRAPDESRNDPPVVDVKGLHKIYQTGSREIHALNDAQFVLRAGETLGVVGESGSGKSTLAKTLIRLEEATEGAIIIKEDDFLGLTGDDLVQARKNIQMIFQDPYASLNPRWKVKHIISEPVAARGGDTEGLAEKLLEQVGLSALDADKFPHEFSGGQRQRIGIARALAAEPSFIICDEVTSALDQLVAEGILRLLDRLQREFNLAYMFITHDLATVRAIADEVVVMKEGRVVEKGGKTDMFKPPHHAYTELLLSSVPEMDPDWLTKLLHERAQGGAGASEAEMDVSGLTKS